MRRTQLPKTTSVSALCNAFLMTVYCTHRARGRHGQAVQLGGSPNSKSQVVVLNAIPILYGYSCSFLAERLKLAKGRLVEHSRLTYCKDVCLQPLAPHTLNRSRCSSATMLLTHRNCVLDATAKLIFTARLVFSARLLFTARLIFAARLVFTARLGTRNAAVREAAW